MLTYTDPIDEHLLESYPVQNKRLEDNFGRKFPYLRLSLTDVCNFKCSYCLPDGYQKSGCEPFLTQPEILRLVRAFANLGVWKIRLTGGEPTMRGDFIDIAHKISTINGIEKLALTTNGNRLKQQCHAFYDAGIRAINISIDSLDPLQFKAITGRERLLEILDGIDECFKVGFETIKINAVLLKGINDGEIEDFMQFAKDRPISMRFIELMRTNDNEAYFNRYHLSSYAVMDILEQQNWQLQPRAKDSGPAQVYTHPDYQGSMGVIAPYSPDFCQSCNRLRMSAKGELHLCLFGEKGYSIRDLLQSDGQQQALENRIIELMDYKRSAHFLHDNNSGVRNHLASIGG